MSEKVLVVRCANYYEFKSLMRRLSNSIYTFKWDEGETPLNYDPYKDHNYLDDMTIYICIEKNRIISYIINGESLERLRIERKLYKLLNANDSMVMSKIHKFTNKTVSKKPFDELNCSEIEYCYDCPLKDNDEVCHAMMSGGKFVDVLKRLGEKYMKAKEKYEKGDK